MGGGTEGQKEYTFEICNISIIGFSMVGIFKMTSFVLYRSTNPPRGCLWGVGQGGKKSWLKYDVIY